jgi:hypothetical protein
MLFSPYATARTYRRRQSPSADVRLRGFDIDRLDTGHRPRRVSGRQVGSYEGIFRYIIGPMPRRRQNRGAEFAE